MKTKKTKKNMWLFILLFSVVFTIQHNAEDLKDKPDSIRHMMGIRVDGSIIEELPGADIRDFTLYTVDQKSAIVWKTGSDFYIYTISGNSHELKAATLLNLLKTNGLKTFVAEREGRSFKFNKYHRVIALQINVPKRLAR